MSRDRAPRVFIGWDEAEMRAHAVAAFSTRVRSRGHVDVYRVARLELQARGLYTRPTRVVDGHLWDEMSNAPMSTGHAIARFFVPNLCGHDGWALFTDGDVLVRRDIAELFALADERYAVMVVQHPPLPEEGTKKDGAAQLAYPRKNWSSVVLFNCAHPAHHGLSLHALNSWPGRDLHRFCWLDDAEIGALPPTWNWLVGVSAPDSDPALVHYTLGTPDVPGHECDQFSDEWRAVARGAGYRLEVA